MSGSDDTDFELQGFPSHQSDAELRARQPVEILASQFVDELRAGLNPSVEAYARRFPVHATTIRESFPMVALLERARLQNEAASIRQNMPERFPFTRLGRCDLICEIGRGGMGVVFQGREIGTQHIVAVKLLPWRVSIVPEWQKRFEEEARTTARLHHRNIVPVYRFGHEHGYCYYVMQFVNGIGLDQIISRLRETEGVLYQDELIRKEARQPTGFVSSVEFPSIQTPDELETATDDGRRRRLTRTSWRSFTQIAIQATQALRYAHGSGILHNDIKPANLMLDCDGRLWITDFGLSQPISPANTKQVPRLMGTLRYMAPERLFGTHNATSDLYSLGMTMYELVTLSPAFEARNEDLMKQQILESAPPDPRTLQPQIPRDFETIILNCISKHPAERYPSADALLADLMHFSRGQKVVSRRRSSLSAFFRAVGRGGKTSE